MSIASLLPYCTSIFTEDEGGGKKKEGPSSSSSGSSSDSVDSGGINSGMDNSQPQNTSSPPREAQGITESEVTGPVDNG